ncbi:hypothetical protein BDV06DRAFT_170216 [Aspergillus oleicola]
MTESSRAVAEFVASFAAGMLVAPTGMLRQPCGRTLFSAPGGLQFVSTLRTRCVTTYCLDERDHGMSNGKLYCS